MAFPRFATEEMEIAGVKIARGDIVLVSLSGANRDDALGLAYILPELVGSVANPCSSRTTAESCGEE